MNLLRYIMPLQKIKQIFEIYPACFIYYDIMNV